MDPLAWSTDWEQLVSCPELPLYSTQLVLCATPENGGSERVLFKSEVASVRIVEADIDVPAGLSSLSTVADFLLTVARNLELCASYVDDGATTLADVVVLLSSMAHGREAFTIIVTDPLGLSSVDGEPFAHGAAVLVGPAQRSVTHRSSEPLTEPLSVTTVQDVRALLASLLLHVSPMTPSAWSGVLVHTFSRTFEARLEFGLLHTETSTSDFVEWVFYKASVCDWSDRDADMAQLAQRTMRQVSDGERPSLRAFHCQLYPLPAAVKAWVAFAAIHHAVVSSQAPCGYSPRKRHTEPRKLRVGYLGSTFRNDPVGHLVFDLFAAHSDRVTVFCYAVTPDDGSVYRRRIQSSCANFRDVSGCSDSVIADVIRSDDVDVLVEMSGHTKGARLGVLASRPCAVQMLHFAAYPAALGAPFVEYIVTDSATARVRRPSHRAVAEGWLWDAETLRESLFALPVSAFVNSLPGAWPLCIDDDDAAAWRDSAVGLLPHAQFAAYEDIALETVVCGDGRCPMADRSVGGCGGCVCVHRGCREKHTRSSRREHFFGDTLSSDAVVMACVCQLNRVEPAVLACWIDVLQRCASAVLVLLRLPVGAESNIRHFVSERVGGDSSAVDAVQQRLVFVDMLPKMAHLERLACCDFVLDTPNRNGHTVTVDALWAGTPVLTVPTQSLAGRVTAGLLHYVGMEDMVCDSLESYGARCRQLVSDAALLSECRARLRRERRRSSLFQIRTYAESFEAAVEALLRATSP